MRERRFYLTQRRINVVMWKGLESLRPTIGYAQFIVCILFLLPPEIGEKHDWTPWTKPQHAKHSIATSICTAPSFVKPENWQLNWIRNCWLELQGATGLRTTLPPTSVRTQCGCHRDEQVQRMGWAWHGGGTKRKFSPISVLPTAICLGSVYNDVKWVSVTVTF